MQRFHLERHDTILHSAACNLVRGMRLYSGELFVSERCVCYHGRLFGAKELELKHYYHNDGVSVPSYA